MWPGWPARRPVRAGLSLSPEMLRLVWATGSAAEAVWHYAQQPCRPDDPPEALAQAFARLLGPVSRSRLAFALRLPAPGCSMRRMTFQAALPAEIPAAVRDEVPKLLPIELDRAQWQYLVQSPRMPPSGQPVECRVAIAACDREPLERGYDALCRAGWIADAMVPAPAALLRAAQATGVLGREAALLMDLAEQHTTIALVADAEVLYAREVALGSGHLTDSLMGRVSVGGATFALSREQARALARTVGIPAPEAQVPVGQATMPGATYFALMQPVLEQLVSEVRRTAAFGAQSSGSARSPERIVFSGTGAELPHLDAWLSKQLAMPVVLPSCERFVPEASAASALALGLALQEGAPAWDLRPASWRRMARLIRWVARLWRALLVIGVVVWLAAAVTRIEQRARAAELRALRARRAEVAAVIELRDALQTHAQLIKRLLTEQSIPVSWFHRLRRGFPDPVRLTQLNLALAREVAMSGRAEEREQTPEAYLPELTLWLETAGLCEGAQLTSSRRAPDDPRSVEFTLGCRWLMPAPEAP